MTPEVLHRNIQVMSQYRINDNVFVKQGTDTQLGTIVDYDAWNADRKVYLVIKMHTESRLRKEDPVPCWVIDSDLTQVIHI